MLRIGRRPPVLRPPVLRPAALRPAAGRLDRLGRFCRRHRWWVVGLWLVIFAAGVAAAGPTSERLVAGVGSSAMESVAGQELLDSANPQGRSIVGLTGGVRSADPAVREVMLFAAERIRQVPGVQSVSTPWDLPGGRAPESVAEGRPQGPLAQRDGTGVLTLVTLRDRLGAVAQARATAAVVAVLRDSQMLLVSGGQPAALVRVGGAPVLNQQLNDEVRQETARSERFALLLSTLVLVLVFGGLVAAAVPVLTALPTVAAGAIVLLGLTFVTDLDANALTVATILSLGLSVDYALLLINRYREELAKGWAQEAAVGRAWGYAGRTILFSGLTVAAALTGMVFFGIPALTAVGLAGLVVAVLAMSVALTLVAALLGIFAGWIQPARHAVTAATAPGLEGSGAFFARLATRVQRRPALAAALATAALLGLAAPVLGMTGRLDGLDTLPRNIEAVTVVDALGSDYGFPAPAALTVVARTDPPALDRWARRWRDDPSVSAVRPAASVRAGLAAVELDVPGDPQGPAAQRLVDRIRADRPPGDGSWVTGGVAVQEDLIRLLWDRLPLAAGVSVLALMLLLGLMTRSVVVPLKAVLTNVLTLAATAGVLTLVFQDGFGPGLVPGALRGPGFNPVILVVILAFAFALSMDYEVFLLARVREERDEGRDTAAAVRLALERTGRLITSAALLMAVTFGCFVFARVSVVQQLGLGLAVAVALDAAVVRCVLVPATMTLLGRWNWWLPRRPRRRAGALPPRAGLPGRAGPPDAGLPGDARPPGAGAGDDPALGWINPPPRRSAAQRVIMIDENGAQSCAGPPLGLPATAPPATAGPDPVEVSPDDNGAAEKAHARRSAADHASVASSTVGTDRGIGPADQVE